MYAVYGLFKNNCEKEKFNGLFYIGQSKNVLKRIKEHTKLGKYCDNTGFLSNIADGGSTPNNNTSTSDKSEIRRLFIAGYSPTEISKLLSIRVNNIEYFLNTKCGRKTKSIGRWSEEFRKNCVLEYINSGIPIVEYSKTIGVSHMSIRVWVSNYYPEKITEFNNENK